MLERNRVQGKAVSFKAKPTVADLAREKDIQFFFKFVQRYGVREEALRLLESRIRQLKMN